MTTRTSTTLDRDFALPPPYQYELENYNVSQSFQEDPETSSIVSAVPSYKSDRPPTYDSTFPGSSLIPPSDTVQSPGLPPQAYALGFQARPNSSINDVESHSYNINRWSNNSSSNNRQFRSVALRRASRAGQPSSSSLFDSLNAVPSSSRAENSSRANLSLSLSRTTTLSPSSPTGGLPSPINASMASALPNRSSSSSPPGSAPLPTIDSSSSSSHPSQSTASSSSSPTTTERPHNPLEDPILVGEAAAARAREERLYRENCRDEALRNEGKAWDFLLAQMMDWEERERSWGRFREGLLNNGRGPLGARSARNRRGNGLPCIR
ncbi:hypothetical protein K402DRAFT_47579 [Aulographum hederae CBS 113979]|uniref:Uncharacterized protein n=1 Tax=Aulographum hederae CBS 113979 TaxID=1176131 RepID=A0A6G1H360_9PEZI|nr:hypothetical protein K402DRAFT_47579 [Aulographum hederae CBS 113979]